MPYVNQAKREIICYEGLDDLARMNLAAGDITYIVTVLLHKFLDRNPGYCGMATAVGILETAKLELYRRKIAQYEDFAIERNGDL